MGRIIDPYLFSNDCIHIFEMTLRLRKALLMCHPFGVYKKLKVKIGQVKKLKVCSFGCYKVSFERLTKLAK